MSIPPVDRSNQSGFLGPIPSRVKAKLSSGLGKLHRRASEILSKFPKEQIQSKLPSKTDVKDFAKGIYEHKFIPLKDKLKDIAIDAKDLALESKDNVTDKISTKLDSLPMTKTAKKALLIGGGFFAIGLGAMMLGTGVAAPVGAVFLGVGILSVTVGVIYPYKSEGTGTLFLPEHT